MADRTIEVALKLITGQFKAGSREAQRAVEGLGSALERAAKRGVDPLNARTVAATTATRAYRSALQQGASAAQASATAARAASSAVDQLGQRHAGARGQIRRYIAVLGQTRLAALAVVDAVRVAGRVTEQFIAIGERAAQRERTARMFTTLSGGAEQATENLRALDDATLNTLSDIEAMEQAVTLLGLRLAETPDELAQIAQQVTTLGARFSGFSTGRSIEQFAFAIGNQSTRRLNEFGIAVDDVTRRMAELEDQGYATEEAFKMATLEAMDEQFQRIGGITEDSARTFDQMRAALANLRAEVEAWVLPAAEKGAAAIRDLADLLSGQTASDFTQLMEDSLEITGGQGADLYGTRVSDFMTRAAETSNRVTGTLKPERFEAYADVVRRTATSWEEYEAGIQAVNDAIRQYNQEQQALAMAGQAHSEALPLLQASQRGWARIQRDRVAVQQAADDEIEESARESGSELEATAEEAAKAQGEAARQAADVREQAARRAATAEISWVRQAEDEAVAAQRRKEDMARRVAQQRAQIAAQYAESISRAERSYRQAVQNAHEQHGKRLVDIERDYRQQIRDIQRDYSESLHEAVVNRDAAAIYRARRTRRRQLQEAREQRDEQVRTAQEQYQEQLQTARETLNEQRRMAAEARQQALADLQESIRQELEAQRIADRRRLEDQARAKRREAEDRQRWLSYRLQQIYQTNAAERTAMQQHYQALAQMRRRYQSQVTQRAPSTPSLPARRPTPYAAGGYTGAGGLSLLHPHEFVLNAQTTRRLEGSLGSLTQEKIVAGGRSVAVQIGAPQFVGVAQQDRGWILQELQAFEGRLYDEVAHVLEGA